MRSIQTIAEEICTLTGHLNAATHRWLMLIAEFDRRGGWSDSVTQSCAHWLNWKCGIALGAAREKVRVARALEKLPKISAAMERGGLSYSKVREITRIGQQLARRAQGSRPRGRPPRATCKVLEGRSRWNATQLVLSHSATTPGIRRY
jgi:hypothetical protein